MGNRWSLFLSGFVVFATWYTVAYVVTSGTLAGLPDGLAFGLGAVVAGLLFGAAAGVTARALELHWLHIEVRRGDARDGARVSLGKLPEIVPVVRHADVAPAAEAPQCEPQSDTQSAPLSPRDPLPDLSESSTPDAGTGITATAAREPGTDAPSAPGGDRLAAECARFVAEHEAVAVAAGEGGSGAVASIDRATNPDTFAAFFVLINTLAGEGVDVSRVAVSAGPDGLPAAVAFPVSSANNGELK